jgi:hypothetical protein
MNLYNHNTLGSQEKPLISNLQFKQIHESLQRGIKTMYEDAQKYYSFESFQKQVLEQEYQKLKK